MKEGETEIAFRARETTWKKGAVNNKAAHTCHHVGHQQKIEERKEKKKIGKQKKEGMESIKLFLSICIENGDMEGGREGRKEGYHFYNGEALIFVEGKRRRSEA